MLRPLVKDGSRPKRDHEITQKEREHLKKIDEAGRNIRTDRSSPGRDRREK